MLPSKVPITCKRAHSHGNNSYGPIRKDMRKQRRRRRLRAGASSSLIALGLLYCWWFDESIFFPNKNGRRLEEYVANNAVLGVLSVYLGKVVGSDGNAIRGLSLSPSLEDRGLSLYLGDGKCKWQPPIYDVPDDLIFSKTLIAGFPSGDKRLTFVQMEALTGLSARDEWDFAFLVSFVVHCFLFSLTTIQEFSSLIFTLSLFILLNVLHNFFILCFVFQYYYRRVQRTNLSSKPITRIMKVFGVGVSTNFYFESYSLQNFKSPHLSTPCIHFHTNI